MAWAAMSMRRAVANTVAWKIEASPQSAAKLYSGILVRARRHHRHDQQDEKSKSNYYIRGHWHLTTQCASQCVDRVPGVLMQAEERRLMVRLSVTVA